MTIYVGDMSHDYVLHTQRVKRNSALERLSVATRQRFASGPHRQRLVHLHPLQGGVDAEPLARRRRHPARGEDQVRGLPHPPLLALCGLLTLFAEPVAVGNRTRRRAGRRPQRAGLAVRLRGVAGESVQGLLHSQEDEASGAATGPAATDCHNRKPPQRRHEGISKHVEQLAAAGPLCSVGPGVDASRLQCRSIAATQVVLDAAC